MKNAIILLVFIAFLFTPKGAGLTDLFIASPWYGKVFITFLVIGALVIGRVLFYIVGFIRIPASHGADWIGRKTTGKGAKVDTLQDVFLDF